MNILVIGNGFDIEHNLPTKYSDFLHYLFMEKNIFEGIKNHKTEEELKEKLEDDIRHRPSTTSFCKEIKGKLLDIIDEADWRRFPPYYTSVFSMLASNPHNMWMEYFIQRYLENCYVYNENWIDFEAEMTNVIQKIDDTFSSEDDNIDVDELFKSDNPISVLMNDDNVKGIKGNKHSFITAMNRDFDYFIKSLHEYLLYIDNHVNVIFKSPSIDELKVDKIFNFNYTDTYRRVYNSTMLDEAICFIHGKVSSCENGVPIVLGGNQKEEELSWCYKITKECQRIAIDYDTSYKDWSKNKKQRHDLYIFGHSLGKADAERLNELIEQCDSTIIYCYGDTKGKIEDFRNNIYLNLGLKKDYVSFDDYRQKKNIKFVKQEAKIRA